MERTPVVNTKSCACRSLELCRECKQFSRAVRWRADVRRREAEARAQGIKVKHWSREVRAFR